MRAACRISCSSESVSRSASCRRGGRAPVASCLTGGLVACAHRCLELEPDGTRAVKVLNPHRQAHVVARLIFVATQNVWAPWHHAKLGIEFDGEVADLGRPGLPALETHHPLEQIDGARGDARSGTTSDGSALGARHQVGVHPNGFSGRPGLLRTSTLRPSRSKAFTTKARPLSSSRTAGCIL